MTSLVIIQREEERALLKKHFKGLEFDYTFLNHVDSSRLIEGLRFDLVYYTPEVMIEGMDLDLFAILHGSLIRMSKNPSKNFRLVG